MVDVASPKETLPVLFGASFISASFRVLCHPAPAQSTLAPGTLLLEITSEN